MPDTLSSPIATMPKRKVLLVDGHPVVRDALAKRINKENDLVVCGEAHTAAEALKFIHEHQPDVTVVELAMDSGRGLEFIKDARSRHNSMPIVVFSMFEESAHALRALQAGAQGYVMKKEPSERLLNALRTVLNGGYAVSQQTSTKFLQSVLQPSAKPASTPAESLGGRELEVFEMLGNGMGTREIAAKLSCSIKTVETYRARIKEKLQLTSATALVREAVRWIQSRP